MNWTVLKAIFRRDFVSYFSNPTGYVFICVFVMLSALAAFWPPDFFSNNLANLDQLNKWLPFILLVFIPAITMSIWAEERRQDTDELLLTLPASDTGRRAGQVPGRRGDLHGLAVVLDVFDLPGVQLRAGHARRRLVRRHVHRLLVRRPGDAVDRHGGVVSDEQSDRRLHPGHGVQPPLAMFGVADWIIKNPQLAQAVKRWSAMEQFRDFERGVISLSGISYFVMIAVVMLYISMVLIGRRHWGGREEDEVDVGCTTWPGRSGWWRSPSA